MHFTKLFALAAFAIPTFAAAAPVADAAPAAAPAPIAAPEPVALPYALPIPAELVHELQARQLDLGGILGNLTGLLGAVGQLLNAETINKLKVVIDGAAVLLKEPTPQQIVNLISTVSGILEPLSGLLTPELVQSLGDAIGALLTPQFINTIKDLVTTLAPLISGIAQFISVLLGSLFGIGK